MTEPLNGRYELGDLLGSGGMGRVYRAHDTRLDRTVAVKILRGDHVGDETPRARLRAEARIAGSLHHPGIAEVFDYDEDQSSASKDPFIVMQYVEGVSLARLLRERGTLPPAEVATILAGIVDALDTAHRAGIVHRDLKPANVMITPERRAVLVDFGIANSPGKEPLTETGSVLGTVEYLSPEQARGQAGTPQSDLYALGVVAHHCLTGVSPFRRDSHLATAWAQINDPAPALDESVPADLRDLVTGLTAKSPADRPTAEGVIRVLAAHTDMAPVYVPPTLEERLPDVVGADSPVRSRRRRRGVLYAGLCAGLAAILTFALVGFRDDDPLTVPAVVGLSAAQAEKELDGADIKHRRVSIDHPTIAAGVVVKQSRPDGEVIESDESVILSVATGKMTVRAASYRGKPFATARAALEKLGFVVMQREVTTSAEAGTVTALDRSGRLPTGATITLSVAVAPAPTAASSTSGSSGTKKTTPADKGKAKGKDKGKKKP